MIAPFVLRLVVDRLAEGKIVGQVEDVETGERAVCRDLDELVAFLHRAGARSRAGMHDA